MEDFNTAVGVAAGIMTIISTTVYFALAYKRLNKGIKDVQEGVKCMLRGSMLTTYYKHHNEDTITQYEYQNFELQYSAYKALGGNSFIDKVHEDITKWEVIQ